MGRLECVLRGGYTGMVATIARGGPVGRRGVMVRKAVRRGVKIGARAPHAIMLSVPEIGGNEWTYVRECLDSGWVSSAGPFVERFERAVAERVSRRFGVATSSGTAALHTALLVAGVEPDDEVLVSTLTFIAPVNAIRYAGAWPVMMDAEPRHWQMDPEKVGDFLARRCTMRRGVAFNRSTGRRVKALVPVHILGHPVDLEPLLTVAREHGLTVIEDATEALGASYRGRPVGSHGDMACFSFNGNKIVTTGGGGVLVTDEEALASRARYLTTQAKDDELEYIHSEIGYNYRLTNIQAAVGCAQMERLDEFVVAKRGIARRYSSAFDGAEGLSQQAEAAWAKSSFWLYTILVDEAAYGMGSRALLQRLLEARIQTRPLWQPAHLSPAHKGCQAYRCDVSGRLYIDALSLPCSAGLTRPDQDRIIDLIRSHAPRGPAAR